MRKGFVASAALVFLLFNLASTSAAVDTASGAQLGLSKDVIYFVMPDRYNNGDTSNDNLAGYQPTETAFYHGGDLKGLTGSCTDGDDGLARLKRLGFTAVWLTPLVTQTPPTSTGAGYHGYWGADFLNVDPHLGSNADLKDLSACAKKLGMKLILDVVTNHTGDVIQYQDRTPYIEADKASLKNPAWLNDLTNYHNSGTMSKCWGEGPCIQTGDFYGLDDLATEKETVYQGMADIYSTWIKEYGFVGFRVDTARHVDNNFFKNWTPSIIKTAESQGISNFTIFGEVWEQGPTLLAPYVRENKIPTVLDFPFQNVAVDWASGNSDSEILSNLFSYDDLYTSKSSNASNLVTFLGNHDMGRAGFLIESRKINPSAQLLPRVKLAHALMYLSRGIPVVYYGDEVGMTGSGYGNDQMARQDMFPTQVSTWKSEKRIGSAPVGSGDSFKATNGHPIATFLSDLSKLRAKYPALANGNMEVRYSKGSIFAVSKFEPGNNREYVVALNNSAKPAKATFSTSSSKGWKQIFGSAIMASKKEKVTLTVPPLSFVVYEAKSGTDQVKNSVTSVKSELDFLSGYYEISAQLQRPELATVEFLIQKPDESQWISLGSDANSKYRVYLNPREFSGNLSIKVRVTTIRGGSYESKARTISIPAP